MKAPFFRVVLVETLYDSNIGAASRAMANMGIKDLILVKPQCQITEAARKAAATGQDALDDHRIFRSWKDYVTQSLENSLTVRIGFSGKDGRKRPSWPLREVLGQLNQRITDLHEQTESTAMVVDLVFGREDWGLSLDELSECHFVSHLPTFGENTSLNLAQAVLLATFLVGDFWGAQQSPLEGQQVSRTSFKQQYGNLAWEGDLKAWVDLLGFQPTELPVEKSFNSFTVLRRMLLANLPTPKEEQVFHAVIQQTLRKLREWKILQNWAQKHPDRPAGVKWPQDPQV